MEIKRLKGRLIELCEIPEQVHRVISGEIPVEPFQKPITLDMIGRGAYLEWIWRNFELSLRESGIRLEDEVTPGVLDVLILVTSPIFSYIIRANPSDSRVVEDVQKEQARMMEAIETVKKELFP